MLQGDELVTYLQTQYFPTTLKLSVQQSQEFCMALRSDQKLFKSYYKVRHEFCTWRWSLINWLSLMTRSFSNTPEDYDMNFGGCDDESWPSHDTCLAFFGCCLLPYWRSQTGKQSSSRIDWGATLRLQCSFLFCFVLLSPEADELHHLRVPSSHWGGSHEETAISDYHAADTTVSIKSATLSTADAAALAQDRLWKLKRCVYTSLKKQWNPSLPLYKFFGSL